MIDIYIKKIGDKIQENYLLNFVEEELKNITEKGAIEQKTHSYSLLKYGAKNSFNIKLQKGDIIKSESGKPKCKHFEFSISHSKNLVVVAISKDIVGIDIEFVKNKRDFNLIKEKCFLESEKSTDFYTVWTKKESIFKCLNKKTFNPKEIDSSIFNCKTYKVLDENENYILSVYSPNLKEIKINNLSKLKVY